MNRREALATLMALPAVKSISVASLQPEDVIVVECDGVLSEHAIATLKTGLSRIWPNRQIVVFDCGWRMRVVRAQDA
jgi:hypothetical protein